ncbi:MAG TPA: matrixin family metalloprotease [Polyangiaceae bacterium]
MRVAIVFVVLAWASTAGAFCRETTVPIDPTFPSGKCWDQGLPVWWARSCVGYAVQQDASTQVSAGQVQQIMDTAFSKWSGAACSTGGAPSITVDFLGDVACHTVEYNQSAGNANVIMFDDDKWPYPASASADTLALTHITYNTDTGELYDADIEVNTAQNKFSLDGTGTTPDLQAVLTHETGHFLGLAHSPDPTATMYAKYVGTSMRSLAPDDVDGICTIYAPDGTRSTADGGVAAGDCDPTPRHGFASDCQSDQPSSGCSCTTAPGAGRTSRAWWLAALLLVRRSTKRRRAR